MSGLAVFLGALVLIVVVVCVAALLFLRGEDEPERPDVLDGLYYDEHAIATAYLAAQVPDDPDLAGEPWGDDPAAEWDRFESDWRQQTMDAFAEEREAAGTDTDVWHVIWAGMDGLDRELLLLWDLARRTERSRAGFLLECGVSEERVAELLAEAA